MNEANGRLVKNTGLLYFRLIFLTLVNLYAVRVTFDALGDIDYGIYSVVASVVASLSILTGAMTSATQRFLSFHLGRNDYGQYSHTFTLLLMTFMALSVVLIVIGEILGFFFIEDWLNIPSDKSEAAYWVFQASLVAFAIGLLTIPYTASIVANERMDAFALFSIIEGILRLAIAFVLVAFSGDRLILYGVLMAVISIVVFVMSVEYCHVKFKYCKYVWKWDKNIFVELSKYTGWNLFGSVSGMLATQGQNILLNIFFGPVINASKAIADRIQHVVNGFSINLYMAASPQIIKSYSGGDYARAISLVLNTSKMSFMLIFVLSFPLICCMDGLLALWMGAASKTQDMALFSQLILIYCMILSLEPPISRIIQATGKIRRYQLSVGVITLSYLPIAAVVLYCGGSAPLSLIILMIVMAIAQVVRVYVAHGQVGLQYGDYMKKVICPVFKVSAVALPLYLALEDFQVGEGIVAVLVRTLFTGVCGLVIVGLLGVDKSDKDKIKELINKRLKR